MGVQFLPGQFIVWYEQHFFLYFSLVDTFFGGGEKPVGQKEIEAEGTKKSSEFLPPKEREGGEFFFGRQLSSTKSDVSP